MDIKKSIALITSIIIMLFLCIACINNIELPIIVDGVQYEKAPSYIEAIYEEMLEYVDVANLPGQGKSEIYASPHDPNRTYLRTVQIGENIKGDGDVLVRKGVSRPDTGLDTVSAIYVTGFRYDIDSELAQMIVSAMGNMIKKENAEEFGEISMSFGCGIEYEDQKGVIYSDLKLVEYEQGGLRVVLETEENSEAYISSWELALDPINMPKRTLLRTPAFEIHDSKFIIGGVTYTLLDSSFGEIGFVEDQRDARYRNDVFTVYEYEGTLRQGIVCFFKTDDGPFTETIIKDYVVLKVYLEGFTEGTLAIAAGLSEEKINYYCGHKCLYALAIREGLETSLPSIFNEQPAYVSFSDFANEERVSESAFQEKSEYTEEDALYLEVCEALDSEGRRIDPNDTAFVCNMYAGFSKYYPIEFNELDVVRISDKYYLMDADTCMLYGEIEI